MARRADVRHLVDPESRRNYIVRYWDGFMFSLAAVTYASQMCWTVSKSLTR